MEDDRIKQIIPCNGRWIAITDEGKGEEVAAWALMEWKGLQAIVPLVAANDETSNLVPAMDGYRGTQSII